MQHKSVEYVQEYAKELTYDRRQDILKEDQLYILAKQHRKLMRLREQVEYIVVDSPLILGLAYISEDSIYNVEKFSDLLLSTFDQYPNFNIVLQRNLSIPYVMEGRNETSGEATQIDSNIVDLLNKYSKKFYSIPISPVTVNRIIELILRGEK